MVSVVGRPRLLSELESEWAELCRSDRVREAVRGWMVREPCLAPPNLVELRRVVEDRAKPERADMVLGALLRLSVVDGGDDPLAARVLLQFLLPGARRLERQLAWVGSPEVVEAEVLATLCELIRRNSWWRRRRRVAANLLADTGLRIRRAYARERRGVSCVLVPWVGADDAWAGTEEGIVGHRFARESGEVPGGAEDAGRELSDLIGWAVRSGAVTREQVALVVETEVYGVPVEEIAARLGVSRSALMRRRQRALFRLRTAAIEARDTFAA